MSRLEMHWQLVLEADGRKRLQMDRERAQARIAPTRPRPKSAETVRKNRIVVPVDDTKYLISSIRRKPSTK